MSGTLRSRSKHSSLHFSNPSATVLLVFWCCIKYSHNVISLVFQVINVFPYFCYKETLSLPITLVKTCVCICIIINTMLKNTFSYQFFLRLFVYFPQIYPHKATTTVTVPTYQVEYNQYKVLAALYVWKFYNSPPEVVYHFKNKNSNLISAFRARAVFSLKK